MFAHLPQLNSVRVFEAAARLGSFKAAAQELSVTPTAVSHQISNLEDKLGVLLFERKARSISLTQEGLSLAQTARQALQQLSATLEDISDIQSVLRITTTTSFAAMWLVPNLAHFQARYPDIQVEIRTGEGLDDVSRDRRIDLAIRYGYSDDKRENVTKLVTEHFDGYATRDYLANLKKFNNATLIETRWKSKDLPPISWDTWLRKYVSHKTVPRIRYFDQEHHVIQAALAGQGIALVSSVLVRTALQQGWLQAYRDGCSLPGLTYYLITSPFSKDLRKVAVFTDWLIEALANNPLGIQCNAG